MKEDTVRRIDALTADLAVHKVQGATFGLGHVITVLIIRRIRILKFKC